MDALSVKFAALADPTRRAILAKLVMGETSVTELAQPFAMSLPAVSKHLKVLENAGLVTRGREAQWRPCRIEPRALKEVDDWLDQYRRFWEAGLDRLELFLGELQASKAGETRAAPRKSRSAHASSSAGKVSASKSRRGKPQDKSRGKSSRSPRGPRPRHNDRNVCAAVPQQATRTIQPKRGTSHG